MINARRIHVAAAVAALLSASTIWASAASDVLALTGTRRTRVVWTQYHGNWGRGGTAFGGSNDYKLMAFDTADGIEREVLGTLADYTTPYINQDGTVIVYADRVSDKTFAVNWDGSNKREIAGGWVTDMRWNFLFLIAFRMTR